MAYFVVFVVLVSAFVIQITEKKHLCRDRLATKTSSATDCTTYAQIMIEASREKNLAFCSESRQSGQYKLLPLGLSVDMV